MDVTDDDQTMAPIPTMTPIYEPPVLVQLGEFGEDTLGIGPYHPDFLHAIGS